MIFKFAFAIVLVAAASAGYAPTPYAYHSYHAAPAHNIIVKAEEYDPHPQYKYSYGVEDKLTGDSKNQIEERDGDVVRGEYSLIDAVGYKRTVKYTADDDNGFNAVVKRDPLVKAVAHYAAPTVVNTVAPVAPYSSPTAVKTHYYSPVKYTSYYAPTYYNYHQH